MPEGKSNPTAERIMDIAEDLAGDGGYDGFSFRMIAADLGIKPASVHYHFPAKSDLGAAMVARYAERFFANLGDSRDANQPADALLSTFAQAFRTILADDRKACLCGIFGAEIGRLPLPVAAEVREFFARAIDWLTPLFARRGEREPRAAAMAFLATLEGALIVARSLDAVHVFDAALAQALRR